MTSQIVLYRQTDLRPDKNLLFADKQFHFGQFLGRNGSNFTNVQYQKIQMNLTLRVQFDQEQYMDLPAAPGDNKNIWDYCVISHHIGTASTVNLYYFVTSVQWRAEGTAELTLYLDVLNSFSDRFLNAFTPKTQITRQHKDRYFDAAEIQNGFMLGKSVDKFPEGVSPTKFLKSASPLLPEGMDESQKFYLIYQTSEDLEVDNITNPVSVYLSAKNRHVLAAGESHEAITYAREHFDETKAYYFIPSENGGQMSVEIRNSSQGVIVSRTYDPTGNDVFWIIENNGSDAIFRVMTETGLVTLNQGGAYVRFNTMVKGHSTAKLYWEGEGGVMHEKWLTQISTIEQTPVEIINSGIIAPVTIEPISSTIDRSSSKLMKIIELPYAPTSLDYVDTGNIGGGLWEWTNGLLKLKNLNSEFLANNIMSRELSTLAKEYVYDYGDEPSLEDSWTNEWEDPKILSSQFSSLVLNYDSFSKEINLDGFKCTKTDNPLLQVSFKMNNSLSSSFAFKYEVSGASQFDEPKTENFHEYLIVNRNNELPIFSSGYIDYIRSGYNYDVKTKETSQKQQFAGLVAGGATAAITAAAASNPYLAAAVGVASLITGITSFIVNERQAQDNIDRKLKELSMQSIGVSGATDVQIMDYYSNNKLWSMIYEPSAEVKKSLNALFHYYGYACNDFGIPNLNSRAWFNFIQCTPVFSDECRVYLAEFITEIEERFKTGVTILHPHDVGDLPIYDMYQTRQNWENSILALF